MNSMSWLPRVGQWAGTATLAGMVLAGCGGGDSSSSGTTTPPTTPAATTTTVSGVAAVGAPIVGAAVNLRCGASATASATTGTTGAWSASVPTTSLPCLVQLGGGTIAGVANAQSFFSLVAGNAAALTANITPLTSLALARAQSAAIDDAVFSSANTAAIQRLATGLTAAVASLQSALSGQRYTVPTGFDPFGAAFTAAAGNPYDNLLEQLKTALTQAGKTYAQAFTGYAADGTFFAGVPFGTVAGQTGPITFAKTGGNIVAADIAPLVGSYSGNQARDFRTGDATINTTSCTINVTADGNIAVTANGRTLAAAINGDVGDLIQAVATTFVTFVIASDVPNDRYAQVTMSRGRVVAGVARQGGFGFSDATNRVDCVINDPYPTTIGAAAASTVTVTNGATAQDLAADWVGTYAGGGCTASVDNKGVIRAVSGTNDVSAQLAGDQDDSIFFVASSVSLTAVTTLSGGIVRKLSLGRTDNSYSVTAIENRVALANCFGMVRVP